MPRFSQPDQTPAGVAAATADADQKSVPEFPPKALSLLCWSFRTIRWKV